MGQFDDFLLGDNASFSNPWDVAFNLLLCIIALTIVARYKLSEKKLTFLDTMKYGVIIMFVFISVGIFARGTANGAGLGHPLEVFAYVIGGAFVVLSLDTAVRSLDRFLLNQRDNTDDE